MSEFRVHHVKFYLPKPKAIHCLSYDEYSLHLAVVRSDFSIEIWDLRENPLLERVIPGHPGNSVEAVVWCKGRLFSTGLHGCIAEYNLDSLVPKHTVAITAGSAWCLGINKQQTMLAAGTEDGYILLYEISSDTLNFEKNLDKQEGRILCLAWHESGEIIVTGSIDTIRIWNVQTGHATDRIIVGRLERGTETIVWCLAVTRDMTIISGDSWGRTSFWDGKTGTLLFASRTHKADVLTLCLNKDENSVYVSGTDPIIIQYVKVQSQSHAHRGSKKLWMKSLQRVLHTHDVRALEIAGDYLISGGVDTHLTFSKYPPKTCIKFSPFSQNSYCGIASETSCLLLRYPESVELWKLGTTSATFGSDGEILPLDSSPIKILQIKSKPGEPVISCAVSSNGNWLAYSTLYRVKLFYLTMQEDDSSTLSPTLKKIKNLPKEVCAAHVLAFTSSGNNLLISTVEGSIQILKCDELESKLLHTFDGTSGRMHLLAVSRNDKFAASGDHNGNVIIYDIKNYKFYCSLPMYKCQPTAIEFDLKSENLIVVYCDRKLVEYNVQRKAYTEWSRQQFKPIANSNNSHKYPITGISFSHKEKNFILHDDSTIYVLNKSKQLECAQKIIKHTEESGIKVRDNQFRICDKYKHLLAFTSLRDDWMVAVEIPPDHILDQLPPPLKQKRYGT